MSELAIRDKKRSLVASHIHTIAKELANEHSPAKITVEDIAHAASISRRTFFNYFKTKEDAILGLQEPVLKDEALTTFRSSTDPLIVRTTQLVVNTSRSLYVEGVSIEERRALRAQYPDMRFRLDTYFIATENLVRPIIRQEVGSDDDTEVILRLTGAIIRYMYGKFLDFDDANVSRTVQQFLETINRIS